MKTWKKFKISSLQCPNYVEEAFYLSIEGRLDPDLGDVRIVELELGIVRARERHFQDGVGRDVLLNVQNVTDFWAF